MVMPGDNVTIKCRADHSDRDGKGSTVRDSRGRTHGRRRHRSPRSTGIVPGVPRDPLNQSIEDKKRSRRCKGMDQKIRIRLKAYDHRVLDQSAHEIVETCRAHWSGR